MDIVISVSRSAEPKVVSESLEALGLQKIRVLERLKVITGEAPATLLGAFRSVPGVEHVEVGGEVRAQEQ